MLSVNFLQLHQDHRALLAFAAELIADKRVAERLQVKGCSEKFFYPRLIAGCQRSDETLQLRRHIRPILLQQLLTGCRRRLYLCIRVTEQRGELATNLLMGL